MRIRTLVLFVLTILPAPAEWLRLQSPQIEILTDAGEKDARRVLERFDQVRRIFQQANERSSPLALRVFLFSSEREFRGYVNGSRTAGVYQSGPERDYILMYAGAPLSRIAAHEYVHLVLNHSPVQLPRWFEEGTAELYSNITVEGPRMNVGLPIPEHVGTLRSKKLLPAPVLAAASRLSTEYNERELSGVFYAQCWALVHMMNLSPEWRSGMPRFAELVASGGEAREAFQKAFGRSMEDAVAALPAYLSRIRGGMLDAPPVESSEAPRLEAVDSLGSIVLRADLALHVARHELARTLLTDVARREPDSPVVERALGVLALATGSPEDGRRHLQRSIELGSQEAETYFESAMLARDARAPRAEVERLLRKTIELNSNYAEAHFLLGIRATDEGEYSDAIEHLKNAVRVLPRQSYFWHALAFAETKVGELEAAKQSARRALQTSATLDQERMAEALLKSLP